MKFKTDENLPEELVELFRAAGHDCRLIQALAERDLHGELWIVHETRIRIRSIGGAQRS